MKIYCRKTCYLRSWPFRRHLDPPPWSYRRPLLRIVSHRDSSLRVATPSRRLSRRCSYRTLWKETSRLLNCQAYLHLKSYSLREQKLPWDILSMRLSQRQLGTRSSYIAELITGTPREVRLPRWRPSSSSTSSAEIH